MKDEHFRGILQALNEMRAYGRGEHVPGLRVHPAPPLDVAAIRKKSGLTQADFSGEIGVSLGTLRNWEQGRRTPEGPARVLLAMLARDPAIVRRTLTRKS